jgi:hypothetical protein
MKVQILSAIAGVVLGALAYFVISWSPTWIVSDYPAAVWMVSGGVIGLVVGSSWPFLMSFALSHRFADWRLHEVEIQGMKFTTAGAQRRVAWALFIEIATRVSTQPMRDDEGDNGIALSSLYNLFQLTRKSLTEMQPTPKGKGGTVETFALDMLNSDLRPFLGKWHPLWDSYVKDGKGQKSSQAWPEHAAFRLELRQLSEKVTLRAKGLARIAGVSDVDRFFPR